MGVNVNDEVIKKIIVDTTVESNFPKKKGGKNDRVAIVKGLTDNNHKFYCTLTVIYANWEEYKTTLTIERLLEDRKWVQIRDTGEGRFSTFVILFNSLLSGTFKNEVQQQSDRYLKQIQEMNQERSSFASQLNEQKEIVKKYKSDIVELETQIQNQLVVIDQQKSKINSFEDKIAKKSISKASWRLLIKTIGILYCSGKSVDEIYENIQQYINK